MPTVNNPIQSAKRLLVVAAIALCTLLTACAPSMTQRIKVTVTIDDNGTLYAGSAVQEWTCTATNNALHGMAIGGCGLKGEAVPVKIGDKGWVFMIFSGKPRDGFGFGSTDYTGAIQQGRSKEHPEQLWYVPLEEVPNFVRFQDNSDPTTVQLLDPRNLAKDLGDGVSLVSVTAIPSQEKITRGKLTKILKWTKQDGVGNLDNSILPSNTSPASKLAVENFRWGH